LSSWFALRHQPVEHLVRHRHEVGMGDPGAVMAVAGFALLVGLDLGEGGGIGLGVVLDRDLRRHAAHGEGAAAMAGLDQQQRIGAEKSLGHHDLRTVGQDEGLVAGELLDEGEDVVPAAAVQAGHVVAQFVEDLVHLEGSRQGLDQHGRLDRADFKAERGLGGDEDIVPEPGLEMALELGQVEVRARALRQRRLGVVEEVEAEIDQRARGDLAVDLDMAFRQVPAARADDQDGRLVLELVGLARVRVGEVDLAGPAIRRLIWPSTILAQTGEEASSKSAMKTLAPEFSALTIILRSTGPVISTRRSCRSAGIGATFQSPSRMCRVSARKSGVSPASKRFWRSLRTASRRLRVSLKRRCSSATKASASWLRTSS
jgi:hypothetical protein